MTFQKLLCALCATFVFLASPALAQTEQKEQPAPAKAVTAVEEVEFAETVPEATTTLSRAMEGGIIIFSVLACLVILSVFAWAIVVVKWMNLRRDEKRSSDFIRIFWDSRSLNDLNGRLHEYESSPAKEVFRTGYAELIRASQLREQAPTADLALRAGVENMTRALQKAKISERSRVERYLPWLAITASAAPFIGLFGTVWGIMKAFEGIAQSGSASLSSVAPGISEALIATAFGLAAAIPAAIGYNIFSAKIRRIMMTLDGFSADFLNIVERYLVSGKSRGQTSQP